MPTNRLILAKRLDVPKTMGVALDAIRVNAVRKFPPLVDADGGGVLTQVDLLKALNAWRTSLVALTVVLFKGATTPAPGTALADLTVPTGSWYAPVTVTAFALSREDDGTIRIDFAEAQFLYSGTDPAEVITGWGVCESD